MHASTGIHKRDRAHIQTNRIKYSLSSQRENKIIIIKKKSLKPFKELNQNVNKKKRRYKSMHGEEKNQSKNYSMRRSNCECAKSCVSTLGMQRKRNSIRVERGRIITSRYSLFQSVECADSLGMFEFIRMPCKQRQRHVSRIIQVGGKWQMAKCQRWGNWRIFRVDRCM